VEHPLLELSCLKTHTFAISIWGGSLFRIAINATPFLLPLMFQVAFGMNAFRSGLMVLALFAGNFSMKSITTPILRRFGFRNILVLNGMISTLLVILCGFLTPATPLTVIVGVLFLHGLSRSMQFTAVNTLSFVDIPKPQMSSASSFSAVAQQMSMGMGVAVAAVSLRVIEFIRGNQSGTPQLMDFHIAFWVAAAFALIAGLDCLSLDPFAGAEVSGHRQSRTAPCQRGCGLRLLQSPLQNRGTCPWTTSGAHALSLSRPSDGNTASSAPDRHSMEASSSALQDADCDTHERPRSTQEGPLDRHRPLILLPRASLRASHRASSAFHPLLRPVDGRSFRNPPSRSHRIFPPQYESCCSASGR
jgi:hypothetical protein